MDSKAYFFIEVSKMNANQSIDTVLIINYKTYDKIYRIQGNPNDTDDYIKGY